MADASASPKRPPFDSLGVTSPLPEDLAAAQARDEKEAVVQQAAKRRMDDAHAASLALRVKRFAAMFGEGLTPNQIESVVKRGEDDDTTQAILRDMVERQRDKFTLRL